MATILARITVREGTESAFEALAATIHGQSHECEPHLRAYGYWRSATPRQYYTMLAFDDYMGFMEHQASDHHEAIGPQLREYIEAMTLEWVDPVPGASVLPPTVTQEVPEDSSELIKKYARRFPSEIAPWWSTPQ